MSPRCAFAERFAKVNGVRLRYLVGGQGSPVVLLHGYAETSHMWRPIMPLLAEHHTVVVPDLRGAGGSAKPPSGYDKKNMAIDIHELTTTLRLDRVGIVGHDIGLMVAYAYAAQFPEATDRVVLMDAFLPGIGAWKNVWLLRDLWHSHFYGEVPLALVKGRERIYLEHFWNDFAADRKHSVSVCRRSVDPCRVPSPSTGVPPSAGPPRRGRRRAGRWPRSGLGCWRGPVRPQSNVDHVGC